RRAEKDPFRRESCRTLRHGRGVRRRLRLSVQRAGGVHYRPEPAARRRVVSRNLLRRRQRMIRFTTFLASLFVAAQFIVSDVAAQAYTSKPVRVIVPWPPGQ